MIEDHPEEEYLKMFATALVAICVRNGYLEELHAGISPSSKSGDFSDVKVVTPYDDIPWTEVSRIDDEQMKTLMKDIVNSVYTVLLKKDDPDFFAKFLSHANRHTYQWDEPELNLRMFPDKKTDQ